MKKTERHEFVEPDSGCDICHAAVYPNDICGRSRSAPVHQQETERQDRTVRVDPVFKRLLSDAEQEVLAKGLDYPFDQQETEATGRPLPWNELIIVLAINPDAATRDDVARLA